MSALAIYSLCCRLPGVDDDAFRRQLEMLELWLWHIRGPGAFGGRVVLLTTERSLPLAEVELVPIDVVAADRAQLFLQRVMMHDRMPVRPGERWMQLDTDTLAMRPLEPLFARPGETSLRAAPSGLGAMHELHASALLGRAGRAWHGRVRGWSERRGVSACLTSCTVEAWPRLMGTWAAAIRRHGTRPPPALGDQAFLNLLHVTGRLPIAPLPGGAIHHVYGEADLDGEAAERATVLHFPNARRLDMMRQRSLA